MTRLRSITPLLFVALTLWFGLHPSAAHAAEPDKKWFQCLQDSECVLVGGGCVMGAVNRNYAEPATQYFNDLNARIECEKPADVSLSSTTCERRDTECRKFFGLLPDADGKCKADFATCVVVRN